ncbi:CDP-glycerol glycerophosphotransferase family protein [Pseudobutyrivibrio sp. LB2011]|uniref:CDP-glycerol glycerophosphotransferase family protein n=1 Tax=Pseudobutyrivibrio sp. LB2011 TaxID=1408312 RepID=UPI0005D2ADAC|nr:CDP-glycerol glycerophosphotransferase family protein [Pseudobutyrivibrio sp. LB2011]
MIYLFQTIVFNILAILFKPFPRNKHIWVTGKVNGWEYDNNPPMFFDNSKYFFLYLVNNTNETVYWISKSKDEIKKLKEMGLPVLKYPSLKAIYIILRAKFSFHHYGPDQLNFNLQRGMIQLDFWHGTPIKKIRYDVVEKKPEQNNFILRYLKKDGLEYIFSTSDYISEKIFVSAFDTVKERILNFSYPRMDVMGMGKKDIVEFCEKYSKELLRYIDIASQYQRVLLYMPTYRDDDPYYLDKANIDFDLLNKKLCANNAVMFFKLHPLTANINIDSYSNIIKIDNDVDIYPFLKFTDFLITDYSSILFDYLVLDKEIIFIPYDYENYVRSRDLYFDYNSVTPGIKYSSFEDFIKEIDNLESLDYRIQRNELKKMTIENYNFDSCERTYRYIVDKFAR